MTDDEKKLVGGTDLAALVGVHPKKHPIDVYRRIVEGKEPAPTPEEERYFRRGHLLEPVIRQMYIDETGAELSGPKSLRHKRLAFLRASPDDIATLASERRVLELKSSSIHQAHQFGEGDDSVPEHYVCQVNHYCGMTGIPVADLAVLLGGDELRIYTIRADKDLIRLLWQAAEKFWRDNVQKHVPPPVDYSEGYADFLAEKFPRAGKEMKLANADAERWATQYLGAKSQITQAERAKEEAANNLKAYCGDAAGIQGQFGKASWYEVNRKPDFDWPALWEEAKGHLTADEQMELLAKHNKPAGGYRAFRITPKRAA